MGLLTHHHRRALPNKRGRSSLTRWNRLAITRLLERSRTNWWSCVSKHTGHTFINVALKLALRRLWARRRSFGLKSATVHGLLHSTWLMAQHLSFLKASQQSTSSFLNALLHLAL